METRSVEPVSLRRILFLALAAMLSLTAYAKADDTVVLRSGATASATESLKLKDVADLDGDAAKLGDTVVAADWAKGTEPGGWATIEIGAVRRALESTPGVNWSRITLRGSSCIVRRTDSPAPETVTSQPSAKPAEPAKPGDSVVRSLVLPRIAKMLGVPESDVRLGFDDKESAILDTSVTDRVVEIEPAGSGDKIPINIRVFEGDRIAASGSIRVSVLVQREVIIAKSALKRPDMLTLSAVTIEKRWVGPSVDAAGISDVGSNIKAAKIDAGKLILKSDLEPAIVVKRGERVQVSCISGGIVVKTTARATQDAHAGDVIKFEGEDSKKRAFLARVDGPGLAVMVVPSASTLTSRTETTR